MCIALCSNVNGFELFGYVLLLSGFAIYVVLFFYLCNNRSWHLCAAPTISHTKSLFRVCLSVCFLSTRKRSI